MDAKNLTELDIDFIYLCAVYETSRSKSAPYYDMAKLAEMGSVYAQQKWFEISKPNDTLVLLEKQIGKYNLDEYETQFLLALRNYRKEKHIVESTLKKMKKAKTEGEYASLKFDITELSFYGHLTKAITLCEEKIKSGKGDLLDREQHLEMCMFNPLHSDEDIQGYRKVRSALAIEHFKDKNNPAYSLALAKNFRLFNPNMKNIKKSKLLLEKLTHIKPSKTFMRFRGPNFSKYEPVK